MAAPAAAAALAGPMLTLKPESGLVIEHLTRLLAAAGVGGAGAAATGEEAAAGPVDTRVGDFDGCYWRIEVDEATPTLIRVCLDVPNFAELRAIGVEAHLASLYGSLLVPTRPDASVSLVLDTAALPASASTPAGLSELVLKVASLRRHVLAFPFLRAMAAVAGGRGGTEAPFVSRLRPREPVYTLTRADRVVVIFHLDFAEATDRAMARLVAQELTEAYRAVNHAPPCSWSEKEPPAELRSLPGGLAAAMSDPSCCGFLTFSLFPTSFKTDAHREAAASQLCLLRSYLMYHLKAAKTYLHARMRNRAEGLQKVLNRAIIEEPSAHVRGGLGMRKAALAAVAMERMAAAAAASGGGGGK